VEPGGTAAGSAEPRVDGGTKTDGAGIDGGMMRPGVEEAPVEAIGAIAVAVAGSTAGDAESPDAGSIAMAFDAIEVEEYAAAETIGGGSERAADRPT
jgi:hypothetical protein